MLPYRFDEDPEPDNTPTNPPSILETRRGDKTQPVRVKNSLAAPRLTGLSTTLVIVVFSFLGGIIGSWTIMNHPWMMSLPDLIAGQPVMFNTVKTIPNTGENSIAGVVYSKVNPAVTQVKTIYPDGEGSPRTAYGSGVVIDDRGYILTNFHIIRDASSIEVIFHTGEIRIAEVYNTDPQNDLALLSVELPPGIPSAKMGDSEAVAVGDVAIAIGSPYGLDQTVTQGIISAVHRNWFDDDRNFQSLLQTDAPINPGNSGGPLINAEGEVIGINTFIQSPNGGSVGIGFAVPINLAKSILP